MKPGKPLFQENKTRRMSGLFGPCQNRNLWHKGAGTTQVGQTGEGFFEVRIHNRANVKILY